jgi:pterin-4a-carbinolamine dehydratase
MAGLAFLSYRRADTASVAQGLYLQLKSRFGSGQLFMDVNSAEAGSEWPGRVRTALDSASVMLALIGTQWLHAADEYGRRRLDSELDWVRRELAVALDVGTPVMPVLIGAAAKLPPAEALPADLQRLVTRQAFPLRFLPDDVNAWYSNVRTLGDQLLEHGLTEDGIVPDVLPVPAESKRRLDSLDEADLTQALRGLPGWEPWEDVLPREYPRVRQELRKNFVFGSFREAVAFMAFMAPRFDEINHHPRWGNEWKIVQIRLTTWDARNKITEWDVQAAQIIDQGYRDFRAAHR